MNWRPRFWILFVFALPLLAGVPQRWLDAALLPGLSQGMVAALGLAHLGLALVIGSRTWARVLAGAALITLPVIGAGALVSALLFVTGLSPRGLAVVGPHYVKLAVNMLTVIPLTLGLVATVPWNRLELRLLREPHGVSTLQKAALMTVRVFSHIFFVVIPQAMEVVREEGRGRGIKALAGQMGAIAVAGICAALRFIGLWAVEIGALPGRKDRR